MNRFLLGSLGVVFATLSIIMAIVVTFVMTMSFLIHALRMLCDDGQEREDDGLNGNQLRAVIIFVP